MSTEFREELRLFFVSPPLYFYPLLLLPGVGVPRRGEVVGELIYLPTRARIYNNVPPSSSFHSPFQTYVLQHPYQSAIYEIVSKKFRKKDRYVWSE